MCGRYVVKNPVTKTTTTIVRIIFNLLLINITSKKID